MRVAYCSDLHLEFQSVKLENTDNSDVLILAGDICVAYQVFEPEVYNTTFSSEKIYNFFNDCTKNFKHVIYIAGNHESYRSDIDETLPYLKKCFGDIPNLYILDNESIELDGITFVGSTLWADANKNDPTTLFLLNRSLNDFRCIGIGENTFSSKDMVKRFDVNKLFLSDALKDNTKTYVVITHHGVSEKCVSDEYTLDYHVNGGYRSILDGFIMDRPQIKNWIVGHSHSQLDVMVGDTRLLRNPRGYPNEKCFNEFILKYFEISA